ncbi:hypothetical protein OAE47_00740 [Akkermansiaceae bacterium]|nr:hypothetical protein [Akkermansiaceae bacterium]MDB4745243.1 hypothetical protein [bacterium]
MQRTPVDELQNNEDLPRHRPAGIVNRHDMAMLNLGKRPGLIKGRTRRISHFRNEASFSQSKGAPGSSIHCIFCNFPK